MKKVLLLLSFALCISAALPLHAQGGAITTECDDSPENPTVVLAVVGTAGAFLASARSRFKARRGIAKQSNG